MVVVANAGCAVDVEVHLQELSVTECRKDQHEKTKTQFIKLQVMQ